MPRWLSTFMTEPYAMHSLLRKLNRFFAQGTVSTPTTKPVEVHVDDACMQRYSMIVGSVFTYFNDLSASSKKRFIQRVANFRAQKEFHFIGMEGGEDYEVLVSASAVQVTFGLKNYLLSYFKNIYVLADAYHMENEDELYIGHVGPDGIYLSWKHFLYGYSNTFDNINVAVHEMAHALLHSNFLAQYNSDMHFRLNYEKFSSKTGRIFADVITKRQSYLRSYAFTNVHEFWAVSVEAFFENPVGLRDNMPDLYEALCRVLNQDPSTRQKLL